MGVSLEIGADIESLGIDVDFFPLDLAETAPDRIAAALFPAEHFAKDCLQPLKISVFEQFGIVDGRLVAAHFFRKILFAEIPDACLVPVCGEFSREVFVHLVLQETADQLFAGIRLFFAGLLVFFAGQEHAALDIQKGCRHDEELAGDIHILVVHLMNVLQILVRDPGDRDIVYINFVLFDQVHEKVERPLEHRQFYWNGHSLISCSSNK